MNEIKKQVKDFLKSDEKIIIINVPKDFKVRSLVNPFRLCYNRIILTIQKMIPPYRFKNALLKSTGMKMGKDVCMAHYHKLDYYFPELIQIDDACIVGGLTKIFTHELKDGKLKLGRVHIKKNALLAGMSRIHPGVTVGEHVITGMKCNISKDCPDKTFVVAQDRIVKEWTDEDMNRLFHKSRHHKDYYKDLKKKSKELRKNRDMMILRILNDGKRLNPGNEWYLARPVWKIYWNSIWIELAYYANWNWLRVLFLKILGVKIGKNFQVGKRTVFDHIYGDLAEIGDNVKIGNDCYVDGHSYTIGETVFGRVKIEDNVKVGNGTLIACGVILHKGCKIIGPASAIKNIPENETWKGIPAKKIE